MIAYLIGLERFALYIQVILFLVFFRSLFKALDEGVPFVFLVLIGQELSLGLERSCWIAKVLFRLVIVVGFGAKLCFQTGAEGTALGANLNRLSSGQGGSLFFDSNFVRPPRRCGGERDYCGNCALGQRFCGG